MPEHAVPAAHVPGAGRAVGAAVRTAHVAADLDDWAVGGGAGRPRRRRGVGRARFAGLGVSVSRSTMLRALMALPIPPEPVPRVLSVDDVALRRGRRYMLNAVGASDLPAVHAFVRGLRKDLS